ncbi:MAG TPA: SDR family oxidoreductase [Vicinamibacterales bacterium]|jgi:NAD(P)-dependent dehydrogenase (short-subunit alcohol dehydrogenase family)
MQLNGRVALLTGARRIGAVVAEELGKQGVDVALSYNRSQAEAEQTASRLKALGRRAITVQADLSRAAHCTKLIEQVVTALGRLDILINMASLYEGKPFAELTEQDWDRYLAVELKAAFLCSRAALPHLRATEGRIINFSDWLPVSGRPRYPGFLLYYVGKGGVKALTEAMALELAPDRILVNAIAPGPILAPPDTTAEQHQGVADATPLGRWGGEREIAKAILNLLDSDFITGETIRVDGGRHLK